MSIAKYLPKLFFSALITVVILLSYRPFLLCVTPVFFFHFFLALIFMNVTL